MNLRDIARRADVMDGQLSLWLMPYLTLRNDVVRKAFEKIVPVSEWDNIHQAFVVCEGSLVDREINGDAPELRGFEAYWTGRGQDTAANWNLFTTVIGGRAYAGIIEAFMDTRDTSYDALEELNAELDEETADPEAGGG
jgi:hypothetical protein